MYFGKKVANFFQFFSFECGGERDQFSPYHTLMCFPLGGTRCVGSIVVLKIVGNSGSEFGDRYFVSQKVCVESPDFGSVGMFWESQVKSNRVVV